MDGIGSPNSGQEPYNSVLLKSYPRLVLQMVSLRTQNTV